MKKIIHLILLIIPSIAWADTVTLKCYAGDNGERVADLVVNIEAKTLKWGAYSEYEIISSNETYITAYAKPNQFIKEVGGEVWSINRVTGEYKRAAVGIYHGENAKPTDKGSLEALTFSGKCSKQQF